MPVRSNSQGASEVPAQGPVKGIKSHQSQLVREGEQLVRGMGGAGLTA